MMRVPGVQKKEERASVSCTRMFHYGRDLTNLTSFNVPCEGGCQQVFQENVFPKCWKTLLDYGEESSSA